MLIAVVSDSHSNYPAIESACELLRARPVEHVFHCGDISDVRAAEMLAGFPTSFVFGNGEVDEQGLCAAIERRGNRCYGEFGELTLAGRTIAFLHGHRRHPFRDAEQSGRYDFLFYGHSHVAEQHHTGPTLVVNPGALYRARTKSIALVDLESLRCEIVPLAVR
jgi:putative phosphoesterase